MLQRKKQYQKKYNLHSTMVLLKSILSVTGLSIIDTSTFHYGSIKIFSLAHLGSGPKLSTFHYGSIKIIFN